MSYTDARNALDWASYKVARAADRRASLTERESDRLERMLARADASDAAEEEQERRDRARRWDESCARHQAKFDAAFEKFGERAPARIADESPAKYRRRMFDALKRKLPGDSDLAAVDPQELGSDLIEKFENMLIESAGNEAEEPSEGNLPDDVYDPRAKRERMDSMGQRRTEWLARESFIAQMSRPGRRVARIINPVTGDVLWGTPYPSARPR
jgi:hypothetical protein